jgi:hypothetical protein
MTDNDRKAIITVADESQARALTRISGKSYQVRKKVRRKSTYTSSVSLSLFVFPLSAFLSLSLLPILLHF